MTIRNLTRMCFLSILIVGVSIIWRYWSQIVHTVKALPGEVQGAFISGFILLLTAILTYFFGLRTYFRKREHEQIRARYLEGGIDCVLKIIYENKALLMSYIIAAQQVTYALQRDESVDSLYKIKVASPPPLQHSIAIQRVSRLLGDSIIGDCIGHWYGITESQIDFLDKTFRKFLQDAKNIQQEVKDGKAKEECFVFLEQKLDEQLELSNNYDFIAEHLDVAVSILEKETGLNWVQVAEFRNRDEVKKIVESMKAEYQKAIEHEKKLFKK